MARRRHCGPIQAAKRKEKYSSQFAKTEKNRVRKRQKHLSLHPNDIQTLKLMKKSLQATG